MGKELSEICEPFPDAIVLIAAQALCKSDWNSLPYGIQQYWLMIAKTALDCHTNENLTEVSDKWSYGVFKALTKNAPVWWNRETEETQKWWRSFASPGWEAIKEYV